MHPVQSESLIHAMSLDAQRRVDAANNVRRAREAARASGQPGLASRLAHAIWNLIDPRGFAISRMPAPPPATAGGEPAAKPAVASMPAPIVEIGPETEERMAS